MYIYIYRERERERERIYHIMLYHMQGGGVVGAASVFSTRYAFPKEPLPSTYNVCIYIYIHIYRERERFV